MVKFAIIHSEFDEGQARNNLQEKRKTVGQAPEDLAKPASREKPRMSCEKKNLNGNNYCT